MPGRVAYLVDTFQRHGDEVSTVQSVDAQGRDEAVALARTGPPGFSGAIAYMAVMEREKTVSVAPLETVGDVPEDYLLGLIDPSGRNRD